MKNQRVLPGPRVWVAVRKQTLCLWQNPLKSAAEVPACVRVEVEQPKPRGRKKKPVVEEVVEIKAEELSLPVEQDQARPEQGQGLRLRKKRSQV